jgi:MFS transporter, PAT family, beta-lactamase induction signal transducer AmpG
MLVSMAAETKRLDTRQSVAAVARSWRLASVSLLSFASGLPLGLVWIAIPTWMAQAGVDIKVIGLFTLAQAPWSFKFLWSPLMDRYPLPVLGRKRGWILLCQVALLGLGLWLAGVPPGAETVWVIGAIALATGFAAASQDIAYDAYTVEVLRKEEQGAAVGARVALYRVAMFVSGGMAITLVASWSWAAVNVMLALCYLPMLLVTLKAPEPESLPTPPRTLKEAVWGPFVGFLSQDRALEILAFVVLFKLADQLTQALTGPFLVQMGFGPADVGVVRSGIAVAATLVGTFLGGLLTSAVGLGRALWITGLLQILSNLGYALVAQVGPNRLVMYSAVALELGMSGMGTGAFGVLLIRLTQKRFSATQYALLSSLFSIPRVLAGPPAALLVDALGWRDFFISTLIAGIPGMAMLWRFVPWSVRDPEFQVEAPKRGAPVTPAQVVARAAVGGVIGFAISVLTLAALEAMRAYRSKKVIDLAAHLQDILVPSGLGGWLTLIGLAALALTVALTTAAYVVARRGIRARPGLKAAGPPPIPLPPQDLDV